MEQWKQKDNHVPPTSGDERSCNDSLTHSFMALLILKLKSLLFLKQIQKLMIQTLQSEIKKMTFAGSGRLIIQCNIPLHNVA